MLLTEEEAKTKWCPMARLQDVGGTYNRCGPAADLYCIASACMMWRKATLNNGDYYKNGAGYCGLASKPEVS